MGHFDFHFLRRLFEWLYHDGDLACLYLLAQSMKVVVTLVLINVFLSIF